MRVVDGVLTFVFDWLSTWVGQHVLQPFIIWEASR